MVSNEESTFPVDGQLLMILPRAGASLRNPDIQLPLLRSDADGYYLEIGVEADFKEMSEVAVTRRVPLENLNAEEWENLKQQYTNFDFQLCVDVGVNKGL